MYLCRTVFRYWILVTNRNAIAELIEALKTTGGLDIKCEKSTTHATNMKKFKKSLQTFKPCWFVILQK